MRLGRAAALLYAGVSVGVVAFQVALAAGAPWGAYAMGGAFPGRFPFALRIAALVQAALVVAMAVVVLSRAGARSCWMVRHDALARVVCGRVCDLSLVLQLMTPSAGERAVWAPVALLLASSTVVAIQGGMGKSAIR